MLKVILLLVLLALVVFAILVLQQPDQFQVSRSMTMKATPDAIFPHVDNLHNWEQWSPWAKLDPSAQTSFAGADQGVGASMTWSGNMQVGQGTMTIVESDPSHRIKFRLDFVKPMQATNSAEFTFEPQGDQTLVTWSMTGTNNLLGKAMSVIFNCEKMVGQQFENGLTDLKAIVESQK